MTKQEFKGKMEELNAQILQEIEQGSTAWLKNWVILRYYNFISKKDYSLFNSFLLSEAKAIPGGMLTFNQIKEKGYHLNKGSKGREIIYYDKYIINSKNPRFSDYEKLEKSGIVTPDLDENGNKIFIQWFLKTYYVYEARNIVDKETDKPIEEKPESIDINSFDLYARIKDKVKELNITLVEPEGSNSAYYNPDGNEIVMPSLAQFNNDFNQYFQTFSHELMHALDYNLNTEKKGEMVKFGSANYSANELIAELGSFHICKLANIVPDLKNTGAYLRGWLKSINKEKFSIQKAFGEVEKIINHYEWLFEL